MEGLFSTNVSMTNKLKLLYFSLGIILTSKSKMMHVHNFEKKNKTCLEPDEVEVPLKCHFPQNVAWKKEAWENHLNFFLVWRSIRLAAACQLEQI